MRRPGSLPAAASMYVREVCRRVSALSVLSSEPGRDEHRHAEPEGKEAEKQLQQDGGTRERQRGPAWSRGSTKRG